MKISTFDYREKIFWAYWLDQNHGRPDLQNPTSTLKQNQIQYNSSPLQSWRRKTRLPRISGHTNCLCPPHQQSLCSIIPYRKPQHPYSSYTSLPRRSETPIRIKHMSLPKNKRSAIIAHATFRIGHRRKIHHSHEDQYHWPIHRHPLQYNPGFWLLRTVNISKTTAVYQIAVTLIGSHNLLVTDGIWALD